jgi:hypothetical protein
MQPGRGSRSGGQIPPLTPAVEKRSASPARDLGRRSTGPISGCGQAHFKVIGEAEEKFPKNFRRSENKHGVWNRVCSISGE